MNEQHITLENGRAVCMGAAPLRVMLRLMLWGVKAGDLALTPAQARTFAEQLHKLADRAEEMKP